MRPLDSALAPARRVCRNCFDLFLVHAGFDATERCSRCRLGPPPRPGEVAATRRFWVHNPTELHIRAFETWPDDALAARARGHLTRFHRRAARRWASLDGRLRFLE